MEFLPWRSTYILATTTVTNTEKATEQFMAIFVGEGMNYFPRKDEGGSIFRLVLCMM
jgi:hypothetical protein